MCENKFNDESKMIELVQKIGHEICEDCNEDRDCGLELEECSRIDNAVGYLFEVFGD